MNVLLVNPPEYTYGSFHNINTYPIGLYNIASYYKKIGHNVEVLDMHPELVFSKFTERKPDGLYYDGHLVSRDVKEYKKCGNWINEGIGKGLLYIGLPYSLLEDKLRKTSYDKIFVTCTFTYLYRGAFEVIDLCKRIQPSSEVRIGGPYVRLCPDHAKKSRADIIDTSRIAEADIIETDLGLFKEIPAKINLLTAMGCPNKCKYCAVSYLEGTSRIERDPIRVVDEISNKVSSGNYNFRFLDSDLLGNWDNHLKIILEEIIRRGLRVNLSSYGGVEAGGLTEDKASLMKAGGFYNMVMPLENVDDSILKRWGRKTLSKEWLNSVSVASKYFDDVISYIMVGFPNQQYSNVCDSIRFCEDNGVRPSLLPFTPIPGTGYEIKEDLESLHPLLWPHAWEKMTVRQLEDIFSIKEKKWFSSNTLELKEERVRYFKSSPPIPIEEKQYEVSNM